MKYIYFIIAFLINIQFTAQTVYQTISNGPWSTSSTWFSGNQPPSILPYGDTIYVNHNIDFNNDLINEGVLIIDSNIFLDGSSSLNNLEIIDKGELINYGQLYVGRLTIETSNCLATNIYLPRVNNYGQITTEHDLTVGSNSGCGSLFNYPGGKVNVGADGTGVLHLDYYLCNQDTIYVATKLFNHGGIVDCCGYIETPLVDVKQFGGRPGTFNCIDICTDTVAAATDPTLEIDNSTYSSLNDAYLNAPSSQINIDNDSVFFCGFNQNGNPPCNIVFLYDSNMYCNDTLNPVPYSITQSLSQVSGYFTANNTDLVFTDSLTGEIFLQNSVAGLYTVYFNYGSCVDSFDLEIVDPAFSYPNAPFCKNSVNPFPDITGTTGGVFSADNSLNINSITGEIDIALSNDTTYTIISDLNSCKDTFQLEIVDASFMYSDTSFCNSASNDTAVVLGNYTGTFTANSPDLSIDSSNGIIDFGLSLNQIYSIYHTTSQGCSDTFNIEIISAAFNYSDTLYCSGEPSDSAIILGNSNGTFSSNPLISFININTGEIDFINSTAQPYIITYTTTAGVSCFEDFNLEIVNSDISYFDSVYCDYSADTLAVIVGNQGGFFTSDPGLVFVSNSTGEIDFDASVAQQHSIVYDIYGCLDTFNLEIVNAEINYLNTIYCKGEPNDSAIILGNSNGVFSSNPFNPHIDSINGEIDFDSTLIGQYSIIYTTTHGCADTFDLELASAHFDYGNNVYCGYTADTIAIILGNTVGVFSSNPSDLVFINNSTGEIDFSNSLDTTYWIYYSVLNTCTDSIQLEIINLQPNAGIDDSVCGLSYQLMGQNNSSATYAWTSPDGFGFSPSDTIIDPVVDVNSEGSNLFILTLSEQQCSVEDSVVIVFVDSLWIDAGPDQSIFQSTADLSAQTNNGSIFYWENLNMMGTILQPDSINSGLTDLVTGDYVFRITASNNICPSVYDEVIYIVDWVFIPSGFSPNGDGINDVFLVEGARLNIDFEMQIVNRWGELLYATSDIFKGWDGTLNGGWAPLDTYFYFIRISDVSYKGYIELKR